MTHQAESMIVPHAHASSGNWTSNQESSSMELSSSNIDLRFLLGAFLFATIHSSSGSDDDELTSTTVFAVVVIADALLPVCSALVFETLPFFAILLPGVFCLADIQPSSSAIARVALAFGVFLAAAFARACLIGKDTFTRGSGDERSL